MSNFATDYFLEVYPWIDKCLYQTFDDAKKRRVELISKNPDRVVWSLSHLDKMNEQGAGIFLSVNGFDERDRKQAKVKYINAWIAEIDHLDKELQRQLIEASPIAPSLIVESKNGYHMYWFAENWTIENWNKICRWLKNFFDSDPAIITLERILRLPWYYHCKDENNKFLVGIVWGSLVKYTEEQMLWAFTNVETYEDKKEKQRKAEEYARKYENDNDDNFWRRVWDINSETMLEILSGTKFVNWDTFTFKNNASWQKQIFVNGLSSPCRIDTMGKIGTQKGAGGWPTRKQRVAWYGNFDWPELYKLIVDKFPMFKKEKKEERKEQKDPRTTNLVEEKEEWEWEIFNIMTKDSMNINYDTPSPFSFWLQVLDNVRGKFDYHQLHAIIWESGSGKTTFTFFQAMKNAQNNKVMYLSLEMSPEKVVELRARKFAWISPLQRSQKTFSENQKSVMKNKINEILSLENLKLVGGVINKKLHIDKILEIFENEIKNWYWLFYIDNLWYVVGTGDTEKQQLDYIIRKCQQFIQKRDCTIILLHHFNKGNTASRWGRWFQDVMSTAKLEHDIDYWIFVVRDMQNRDMLTAEEKATTYIEVKKDRYNGIVNKVPIYFDRWGYTDTFNL